MTFLPEGCVFPNPDVELQVAGGPHEVGLQGWDTASILTLDAMNKVVKGQNITLPALDQTSTWNGEIHGVWDSWDMIPDPNAVGGAVRFCCTLKSGHAIDVKGTKYPDLKGTKVYITVSISPVKDPSVKLTDPTADAAQPGEPWALYVQSKPHNHVDAVTVDMIEPSTLTGPFKPLFELWFNKEITSFNPLFHAALLNTKAAHGAYQWVKPTLLSYASLTNAGGDGYFAALCKTDKQNPSWNKLANQIDSAVADDWPSGVNSIFAISGPRFAEEFLKRGAVHIFRNAKPEDFDVDGDQLIVTNNKMLVWGDFRLEDGTQVSPTVPKNGLTMKVVEDKLSAEFTGVTWSHPLLVGSDIFTLNFTQNVYLKLGKNSKGQPVIMTTNDYKAQKKKNEVPDIERPHVSARPDRAAVQFDRWSQIVGMVLSVVSLGTYAAGKWIVNAAEAAQTASSVTNWINSADDVLNIAVDGESAMNSVSQTVADSGNLAAAAAFVGSSQTVLDIKYGIYLLRFSQCAGLISAISLVSYSANMLQLASDQEFDPDALPDLNNFLENVLGAEHWPGVTGTELKHVRLAQSLLLYFNRTM